MKNKKKTFFIILLAFFIALPLLTQARVLDIVDVIYKPNVPIPIQEAGYDFSKEIEIRNDGSFLPAYIAGIYRYAAGFAGIVAMFMLVIAAWRWLFAAGNAQKINASKDMVNGILIGLALIFGGQLLLSQISEDFNYISYFNIANLDESILSKISEYDANAAMCNSTTTPIKSCSDYDTEAKCRADACRIGDPGDYDEVCIPEYKKVGTDLFTYEGCTDCYPSWIGTCDQYSNAIDIREDPCDYDGDGLGGHTTDPDGCKDHTNMSAEERARAGIPYGAQYR